MPDLSILTLRRNKFYILFIILFVISEISFAQNRFQGKSDSIRTKNKISFQKLRVYFDDDFINFAGKGTDQYYTGGWQFDVFYKRNYNGNSIFDRLLIRLPDAFNLYSYGIRREIYTPADLSQPEIVYGDRPYASVLTLQHGLISTDRASKECLLTDMGLGAIGPMTYGSELQTWFHNLIDYQKPMGWNNQIKNDIVLDYKINYERQLIKPSQNLEILANIDCEAGTLADNFGVGITVAFGSFNSSFIKDNLRLLRKENNSNKVAFHFYMHPSVRVVMYDATLEGGFFSEQDPYVINKNNINYVYLQYDFGAVLQIKNAGISFTEKLRTAEFKTEEIHQVGNFTFFIPL